MASPSAGSTRSKRWASGSSSISLSSPTSPTGVSWPSRLFRIFYLRTYYPNFIVTLIVTTLFGGFVGVTIEKLIFRPIRLKGAPLTLFLVNSVTAAMLVQQFFAAAWGDHYYPYPVFYEEDFPEHRESHRVENLSSDAGHLRSRLIASQLCLEDGRGSALPCGRRRPISGPQV